MQTGRWYTLTEASLACSVSRSTVKRYLWANRLPNAVQETTRTGGAWFIPERDLTSVGWHPDPFLVVDGRSKSRSTPPPAADGQLLRLLQSELHELRDRFDAHCRSACSENVAAPSPAQGADFEQRLLDTIRATIQESL